MNKYSRISVAPMVDWTDTWFRRFARILTAHAHLYTEMITAPAILHGDRSKLLDFHSSEKPLVLQIAADSPDDAAKAVEHAEEWDYDEINLNIGCPSDKVQQARFGACLMAEPELVRDIISAMKGATVKPVTVKHRIGIDDRGSYEDLKRFTTVVAESSPARFIVHSRIALLQGLDPKQNRTVPPIRHEDVHRLKVDFPKLVIEVNGEIETAQQISSHLEKMDGVMIGRGAYENPVSMASYDAILHPHQVKPVYTYRELLQRVARLDEEIRSTGIPPWKLYRHLSGLIKGRKGAKEWRRFLIAKDFKESKSAPRIKDIIDVLPGETLASPIL